MNKSHPLVPAGICLLSLLIAGAPCAQSAIVSADAVAPGTANESRVVCLEIPREYLTNDSLSMGVYQLSAEIDLAAATGTTGHTLEIGMGHIASTAKSPRDASVGNRSLFCAALGEDQVVNVFPHFDKPEISTGIKVASGKALVTVTIDSRNGNLIVSASVNGAPVIRETTNGGAGKPLFDSFTGWNLDQVFVSDSDAGAGSIRNLRLTGTTSAVLYPSRLKASDPSTWKPVQYVAASPIGGVTLDDNSLFKQAMTYNIDYLLNSFSVNHMLYPFRQRHGEAHPPDDRSQEAFWDHDLRGSNAGRFLMGAGNTLCWIEHPELRKRVNEMVDGIAACREPNGYILPYPPGQYRSEEPNYARAWLTQGLIAAGLAGNKDVYPLLRSNADWFNHWDLLPRITTVSGNAQQGQIASTKTYFTPIGKPEDLQTAEKYYVQDWWLDALAARHGDAIWKYPLLTPHSYLICSFIAYMDLYRATGDQRYLTAMNGAWSLIHDQWEHIGGSMAICEGPAGSYPPGSNFIGRDHHTGETCGSDFWISFNEQLAQFHPMDEKYVNEIEKSIYNVVIPAQVPSKGIKYHAFLEGTSDRGVTINTCCEGQTTRLLGSLPEYIYSVAKDGLYVNLFEPSAITFPLGARKVQLAMTSRFPWQPDVSLKLAMAQSAPMKLRIRVPAWAASEMAILVNGAQAMTGEPGTYAVLDRTWKDGDTISFVLPMQLHFTEYHGASQIPDHTRYALEYGPILMAAIGPLDHSIPVKLVGNASRPQDWIKPVAGQPLQWQIDNDPGHSFIPYWKITDQTYTCFPVVDPPL